MAGARKEDALLDGAAKVAITEVLGVRAGERVLIITNPETDVDAISRALYRQAEAAGTAPALMYQPVKGQLDFADEGVIAALRSEPEVVLSISREKLGKDRAALSRPIKVRRRGQRRYKRYHHTFDYLLTEARSRSFWSPSVTVDMFIRTVPIDYSLLRERAGRLAYALTRAEEASIETPSGTNAVIGLRGRKCKKDDGNFRRQGTGGNLPAGEVFISPELGVSRGALVFDGSISSDRGDIVISRPIECRLEGGFVTRVSGGEEARKLKATLDRSRKRAMEMASDGRLPSGKGEVFAKNSYNVGELGIGLNPAARIMGNMLEDEKAFRTCHLAIGADYDDSAPALTHLDGLMREPTITVRYASGRQRMLLKKGELH